MSVFTADNKAFAYMGRIDFTDPKAPMLIYPGSNIRFLFGGRSLKIIVENIPLSERMWIGALIDGVQQKIELSREQSRQEIVLAEGLDNTVHSCMIFKRQAAAHYFRFISAECDSIQPENHKYDLKIEYFGDSVSAGEVTEAVYYEGMPDPENHGSQYDNSYFSYTFSTARKLNACFHNNSQGGIALFDHTGYFYGPAVETLTGVETTYDKLSYVPYAPQGLTPWDFERYTPDIVVFAIGQNDANPDPEAVGDPEYMAKWRAKFREIILDLKSRYKTARFVLILTVLKHDLRWEDELDKVVAELADPDITRFRFTRSGLATDGHPRITEQEEMALELSGYLRTIGACGRK